MAAATTNSTAWPFTDGQLWKMFTTCEGKVFVQWVSSKTSPNSNVVTNKAIYGFDLPGGVHSYNPFGQQLAAKGFDKNWVLNKVAELGFSGGGRAAIQGERVGGITWGWFTNKIPDNDPYYGALIPIYREKLKKSWNDQQIRDEPSLAMKLAKLHSHEWRHGGGNHDASSFTPNSGEKRAAEIAVNFHGDIGFSMNESAPMGGVSDKLRVGPPFTNESLTVGIRNWVQILTQYVYTGGGDAGFGGTGEFSAGRTAANRWVDIKLNFRTIAGWTGADGKQIIGGIIYRGRDPKDWTEAERNLLKNEGIGAIANLRGNEPGYNCSKPSWASGYDWEIFGIGPYSGNNTRSEIKRCLEWIASKFCAGKKVYFHCQEGLNRTGSIAGHLLSICGVSAQQQKEENLLSTEHLQAPGTKGAKNKTQYDETRRGVKDYGDAGVGAEYKTHITDALLNGKYHAVSRTTGLATASSSQLFGSISGRGKKVGFVGDSWFDAGAKHNSRRHSYIKSVVSSLGGEAIIKGSEGQGSANANHSCHWGYRWDNGAIMFSYTQNCNIVLCDFGINDSAGSFSQASIRAAMTKAKNYTSTNQKIICWGILPVFLCERNPKTGTYTGKDAPLRNNHQQALTESTRRAQEINSYISSTAASFGWGFVDPFRVFGDSGMKTLVHNDLLSRFGYHFSSETNWQTWVKSMIQASLK